MSVLNTVAICWVSLNSVVFAALATRKSRPRLRARLFNWVLRNGSEKPRHRRERHPRPVPNTRVHLS